MSRPGPHSSRRQFTSGLLAAGVASALIGPSRAFAFGEEGAFNPRVLLTGTSNWRGIRASAPARWSLELIHRTSAPARLAPTTVRPDSVGLLAEPFAVWGGSKDLPPLTAREIQGLRRFITLGGILLVDDFEPDKGLFSKAAKRELRRVLPAATPIKIGPENVVFRTFYLLRRALGRVAGPDKLEAIVRGGVVQVIFSRHDLLGALARGTAAVTPLSVTPGGEAQREQAIRLAVNIAMYVLCSNYKDDQVHAEHLMRRRGAGR